MSTFRFRPKSPDVKVRDPLNRMHLPAEGVDVLESDPRYGHFLRLLRAGDVTMSEAPALAPAPVPQPKKEG